jgi:hypothetical protein
LVFSSFSLGPDQKNVIRETYQEGYNSRQFWKLGVGDKQEYFTLMNNETKTFMTAINNFTQPKIKST